MNIFLVSIWSRCKCELWNDRGALKRENPINSAVYRVLVRFVPQNVEPEGVEPSSKHSMIYAFYMLSFSLIVERGKVSRLPIPYSVFAVSRLGLAKSPRPVLLFDAPNVRPKNRI